MANKKYWNSKKILENIHSKAFYAFRALKLFSSFTKRETRFSSVFPKLRTYFVNVEKQFKRFYSQKIKIYSRQTALSY